MSFRSIDAVAIRWKGEKLHDEKETKMMKMMMKENKNVQIDMMNGAN